MQDKIKSLQEIEIILETFRNRGEKVVQCHGVFDLLHPGHIRHLKQAKSQGDHLVVSVTPDRFVNKGPGRPAFNETLRVETLAALEDIDFVVLNDSPDAVSIIRKIRPSVYVKGIEYNDHAADVTGKISEESQAVSECGGKVFYTDDIVFSSSSLLNRYFDPSSPEMASFLEEFKKQYSVTDVLECVEKLKKMKVLVIGDAIVDEYQYTDPLGQSGKGLHMVARCLDRELFLGGSLIIASHVAQFAGEVSLLTAIGANCPHRSFIEQRLPAEIDKRLFYLDQYPTLTKKRYVLKDGRTISKLFETYSSMDPELDEGQTLQVLSFLKERACEYDLVIAADFGNGLINPHIVDALSQVPGFFAINTQTNSGNRGYNVITKYARADFISVNEPELRLATHDKHSSLHGIVADVAQIMHCPRIAVTRGVRGVFCFSPEGKCEIPAITLSSVDRIGAGDSFLSLASLNLAAGSSMVIAALMGSVAAAMSVQMIGNSEPIQKAAFCKFLTRVLK